MGSLLTIWIKRGKRAPMDPVEHATLEPNVGILGNANIGGKRQVTLIERGRWDKVCAALDSKVDPSLRRANLLIDGLDLEGTRGRLLEVGQAAIRIHGETVPCRLMDELHAGLQDALRPHWGGGVFGTVERGGRIQVGDAVRWSVAE